VITAGRAPSVAAAQASSADKALAEALFDRGLTLMRQGQFEEAAAQLEQSQAIERGIGTLLYLAECYEKLGRTASAWAMFREAASAARAENQADRARAGTARAERLEPILSRLTVLVPHAGTTPGLIVKRNGQVVPAVAFGVALPTDPGAQLIEASAPGRLPWSVTITLPAGASSVHVDVPNLAIDPQVVQPSAAANPTLAGGVGSPPPAAPRPALEAQADGGGGATWQRPLGLSLIGAGVVAIGVGSYFGARAISKNTDLERACPQTVCDVAYRSLQDDAESAAAWSTALFVGGGVLAATGAVLFITAPRERALSVAVNARREGAELRFSGSL